MGNFKVTTTDNDDNPCAIATMRGYANLKAARDAAPGRTDVAATGATKAGFVSEVLPTDAADGGFSTLANQALILTAVNLAVTDLSSTVNSATLTGGTLLAIGANFPGQVEDARPYLGVSLFVKAAQSSAADGLTVTWYQDELGTIVVATDSFTVTGGTIFTQQVAKKSNFYRTKYINGGVTQTGTFILETRLLARLMQAGSSADPMTVDINSGPTGASALQLQGTAANGAAPVGKPVNIAGIDGAGHLQTLLTGVDGAARIESATPATNTAIATNTIDEAGVAATPGLRLMGFSVQETASAVAKVVIRHGTGNTDPAVAHASLAADGALIKWFGPQGIDCPDGIWIDRVSGDTEVSIYSLVVT